MTDGVVLGMVGLLLGLVESVGPIVGSNDTEGKRLGVPLGCVDGDCRNFTAPLGSSKMFSAMLSVEVLSCIILLVVPSLSSRCCSC